MWLNMVKVREDATLLLLVAFRLQEMLHAVCLRDFTPPMVFKFILRENIKYCFTYVLLSDMLTVNSRNDKCILNLLVIFIDC